MAYGLYSSCKKSFQVSNTINTIYNLRHLFRNHVALSLQNRHVKNYFLHQTLLSFSLVLMDIGAAVKGVLPKGFEAFSFLHIASESGTIWIPFTVNIFNN